VYSDRKNMANGSWVAAGEVDAQKRIQTTNSWATSTYYGCLEYHLCCSSSFHDSKIENANDSCSCSYCISSKKSKTRSASSSENVEIGNGNENKISSVSGWNAQSTKTTSICVCHTRHARSLVSVYVGAQRLCGVAGNGAWNLDGTQHVHLFPPFQSQTYLHPFRHTLHTSEVHKYHASCCTVGTEAEILNETRNASVTENVSASMNAHLSLP